MAKVRHPRKVRAAVDAIAQSSESVGGAEIARRLKNGEIDGLEPYEVKVRTVQGWVVAARKDLDAVHPDEVKAINALERRMLKLVNRDVARIEAKQRATGLSAPDSAAIRAHHLTISQIRNERRRNKEAPPDPERSAAGMNGKRAQAAQPSTLLERIGAELDGDR